jgi:hypothetical protein
MSKSDDILNSLVWYTQKHGGFVAAWSRIAPDDFTLKATGRHYSKNWANAVLQQIHPGADIDALFPPPKVVPVQNPATVVKPVPASAAKPAGTLSAAQWRSINEADAAAEGRRRRR